MRRTGPWLTAAAACIVAATMAILAAGTARADEARSIAFQIGELPASSGDWAIERAWFTAMVDPDACTDWYSDLPLAASWTWSNNGSNVTPFALTVGFGKSGGSGDSVQTAIRCVAVDPENMSGADAVVVVDLQPCEVSPGRPQLRLADIRQAGVEVKRIGGEPHCN